MNRIIFTLILLITFVPSIALASWWNPASWFDNWDFIFKKKDTNSEILEKRIVELETQLKNSTGTSTTGYSSTETIEQNETKIDVNDVVSPRRSQNDEQIENEMRMKAQAEAERITQQNKEAEERLDEINARNRNVDRINADIKKLNQKYSDDIEAISAEKLNLEKQYLDKKKLIMDSPGQSAVFASNQISALNQQYGLKFSELDIKRREIEIQYNKEYRELSEKYNSLIEN